MRFVISPAQICKILRRRSQSAVSSRRLGSLTCVRGSALFGGVGDIVAKQDPSKHRSMGKMPRRGFAPQTT
jgi:hypothetical protein